MPPSSGSARDPASAGGGRTTRPDKLRLGNTPDCRRSGAARPARPNPYPFRRTVPSGHETVRPAAEVGDRVRPRASHRSGSLPQPVRATTVWRNNRNFDVLQRPYPFGSVVMKDITAPGRAHRSPQGRRIAGSLVSARPPGDGVKRSPIQFDRDRAEPENAATPATTIARPPNGYPRVIAQALRATTGIGIQMLPKNFPVRFSRKNRETANSIFSLYFRNLYGAPGEIRTPDHLVRSQVLYPTELRALRRMQL